MKDNTEIKILDIEPCGSDLTFIDCKLVDVRIAGISGVEVIISPVHERWTRRAKAWFFGMRKRYKGL